MPITKFINTNMVGIDWDYPINKPWFRAVNNNRSAINCVFMCGCGSQQFIICHSGDVCCFHCSTYFTLAEIYEKYLNDK